MSALGDKFRVAREARGLSLSTVAEKIHIRSVYLDALERGDWSTIGAPVYVRGFIRTYARYLTIDPEIAVAEFREEIGEAAGEVPVGSTAIAAGTGPSPLLIMLALVAVGLVGYAAYAVYEWKTGAVLAVSSPAPGSKAPSPAGSAAAPMPAETLAVVPTPMPTATKAAPGLEIHLTKRSWVRVSVDGTAQMEGEFPAGTQRKFLGNKATVRIGNAAGVDIVVNGKDVGSLGADGEVAERTFLIAAPKP